jgi:hypothetical protein
MVCRLHPLHLNLGDLQVATFITSLKWIVYAALALLTAIALSWWLVPDEALDPEAAHFVAQPASPPSARNASFMIWGLAASPELDPHAVGRRIVATQDRMEAAQRDSSEFKEQEFLGANPLTLPKENKPLCDAERENCLLVYQKMPAEIDQEITSRKVFLERYRSIRNYEEFVSANSKITETTALPNWRPVLHMSELVNASIALDMRFKDRRGVALKELAADVRSWRKILTANDWLITQMIAVIALHRKYRLASEIMNAYPEVIDLYPDLMQTITAPIPVAEAGIVSAVKTEARVSMQYLWNLGLRDQSISLWKFDRTNAGDILGPIGAKVAYQPHASINDAHAAFSIIASHLAKPPKEYLVTDAAFKEELAQATRFRPQDIFYNFAGRLGLHLGLPDLSKYYFRMHDLVGLTRLVDLQRRIIAAKLPPQRVGESLSAFGAELMDPYTGQPMQWNASSKQLSFVLHGKRFANFGFVAVAPVPGTQQAK